MLTHRGEGDIAGTVGLSSEVHQDGDQQGQCSCPSKEDTFSSEHLENGPGGVGAIAEGGRLDLGILDSVGYLGQIKVGLTF